MPTHPFVPALDVVVEAEAKWLTEVLLDRPDCDNFRKLEALYRGIRAAGVTHRFRPPSPTTPDLVAQWADIMYGVFHAMNCSLGDLYGFLRSMTRFLVVGSNPGGFTRFILEHSNARGVGVSLPVDSGGIGLAIPPDDRFELHELDVLDLVSHFQLSDPMPRALPFTCTQFELIVLDITSSRPRILIAQLLLALHTIYNGGQILLTLSCIERPLTARILIAFSKIADYLDTYKPPQVQAWSGLFYLHARVVRTDTPAYRKLKDNLQRLWNRIHSTHTEDPTWDEQDLISPWEEVMKKSNVDLVVKLGNPLWGTRLAALHRALDRTDGFM
ncbi:hypothetical protein B0J17DRAFT_770749 [Rhizoctonia solani]|nr:hypothetical protein B0J17DRAFT_770749 [Rhizoctonia solani]